MNTVLLNILILIIIIFIIYLCVILYKNFYKNEMNNEIIVNDINENFDIKFRSIRINYANFKNNML